MLLISCSLALLVVFAGTKLLILIKKEVLGMLYKCVAWFLIMMGFILLMGTACLSIAGYCHKGGSMMESRHGMMEGGHGMMERKHGMIESMHGGGACMNMGGMGHHCMMMNGCGSSTKECCPEMMGHQGYEMKKCHGHDEECGEKMDEGCDHSKRKNDKVAGECCAKKTEACKKDSLNKKMSMHHK